MRLLPVERWSLSIVCCVLCFTVCGAGSLKAQHYSKLREKIGFMSRDPLQPASGSPESTLSVPMETRGRPKGPTHDDIVPPGLKALPKGPETYPATWHDPYISYANRLLKQINKEEGKAQELRVEQWTGTLNKAFIRPVSVNVSQHAEFLKQAQPPSTGKPEPAGMPPVYISNSRDKSDQRVLDEDERLKFDAERVKALDNPPTQVESKVPSWKFFNGADPAKAPAKTFGSPYGPASDVPVPAAAAGGNIFGSGPLPPGPAPSAAAAPAGNTPANLGATDPAAVTPATGGTPPPQTTGTPPPQTTGTPPAQTQQ